VNFFDIATLVIVGYGAYKGFKNGVIIEVASLVGVVIGFWAGMRLAFIFANYYRDNFEIPSNYVPALAFFTAFALGLGAVYLAGWAATKLLKTAQLNLPNRLAGAAFGILKWAFLFGSLVTIIGNSQILGPDVKESSKAYPVLSTYCSVVQGYSVGLLPQARNVFDDMEHYFVQLDSVRQANKGMAADSTAQPAE
jgi:membrane protein required for colicin V production